MRVDDVDTASLTDGISGQRTASFKIYLWIISEVVLIFCKV